MSKFVRKSKPLRKSAARKRVSRKVGVGSGMVAAQIHGGGSQGAGALSPGRLIEAIREGLPASELEFLRIHLGVPMDKLTSKLGISKATLHRRKAEGRLAPAESERVLRLARLLGKAIKVMESEQAARLWLTSPQAGLGGETPLDFAETDVGAREVEDLLGRIEYGVYS